MLDAIRSEQVATLFRYLTVGVLGGLFGLIILVIVLVNTGSLSFTLAALWVGVVVIAGMSHLLLRYMYGRAQVTIGNWRPWAYCFTMISFVEGVWMGLATLFLARPDDFEGRILVLLVTCTVTAAAVPMFSTYLPAFYALFFPAALPNLAGGFLAGDARHGASSLMDIAFVIAIGTLAYKTNTNFTAMVRLNLEKDMLMEKLRREKERAEEANLAKSRFLASASHDLRQPMHALSLFIGALSSHPMNAEMRGLVEHIEGSITAMDGLFGSLLDISRIDAGVVQPQFEAFELQPLLQRLCEDHAVEAHDKGNLLRQVPCTATIYTDPVLLERILLNVISNAVRYTDCGRILVGARWGKRLSIEVHDTGRGIPFDEQDRIFEEFYQIKNPERDRAKGLGLGLAIVKRLALVLECPFELTSQPGKGTIFKLSVPVLDSPHLYPLPAKTPVTDVAGRGLILVVDDEVAVQEGMRSLLCSWGYDVIIAGSCAQMIAEISNCPVRADLIICDYRLRDGENGIDVILRLQSEYNEEIPAVLITGDTAPDRLVEATASGFTLLHKPVSNAKLRATIRSLMNA